MNFMDHVTAKISISQRASKIRVVRVECEGKQATPIDMSGNADLGDYLARNPLHQNVQPWRRH